MLESIDNGLWAIKLYLMKKYGVSAAEMDMYPLEWYVRTGRASVDFIKKCFSCKPFMIARRLHDAPSCDEAIRRVKEYIYGDSEAY